MGYICTRCGGTKVACEAIVNPNTREIIDYFDGSFAHAICGDCENEVIISNVEDHWTRICSWKNTGKLWVNIIITSLSMNLTEIF